ncbi:DNA glycosylase AlkZ-like family protein [Nocardioides sp.]|uniref:DNA glycosylase AlkZ-like family protein n=1 Tax=Nocardioides sp. TaxID=35761 RepID=UPI002CDEBA26|nr:crosslink repair DNA glycosylase YcaQ family protein [Nocardioides sp.]HXH79402.1 crosslink repair DNA glycosylase YcaQ family protein [Nocardioides sp.]
MTHELSRADARRVAVLAQLLSADRPSSFEAMVDHLTLLQAEPTAAVAPSAQVVTWSRLGERSRPGDVDDAVAAGSLIELHSMLRPAADLKLYRAEMAAWPGAGELKEWQVDVRDWVEANDDTRRDILGKLHDEGPLTARSFPDTTLVPWESSGWNNDRNIRMLLDRMVERGEIAPVGHEGRDKLWDLAERVYPDEPVVPLAEALHVRSVRRLRSLGIARGRAAIAPNEPNDVGEAGEPAVIEGLRGTWRVDPAYLEQELTPRVALLSPLDRLVFDRRRMAEIFEFDYQLEMYKPAAKRKWGYWAMPILDGDRLVGKVDVTADRRGGLLVTNAVHEDEPFSADRREAVQLEIESLARWLDLQPAVAR